VLIEAGHQIENDLRRLAGCWHGDELNREAGRGQLEHMPGVQFAPQLPNDRLGLPNWPQFKNCHGSQSWVFGIGPLIWYYVHHCRGLDRMALEVPRFGRGRRCENAFLCQSANQTDGNIIALQTNPVPLVFPNKCTPRIQLVCCL
jgi:hypothetical protein